MAAKKRSGRGAGGAAHETAHLVRFTSEQDAAIREAAAWAGAQISAFIREAAVTRARDVLAEKARQAGAAAPPKGPGRSG